jgi:hypothetical protein
LESKNHIAASDKPSELFHTTLVRTLNALAGLIPVTRNINILMHKAALHSKTLPISYPGSLHNIQYSKASKDHKLPLYWMSIIGGLCDDGSTHLLPCSYSGSHLVDIAVSGNISEINKDHCKVLISYYKHSKKAASAEFYAWLQTYHNKTNSVLSCQFSTVIYTDDRVCTTASRNKEGASAYSLCREDGKGNDYVLLKDLFKCRLATPFNAEIAVAATGIERAVELLQAEFECKPLAAPKWHMARAYNCTLVLCIDNQAVAFSIMTGTLKLGHALAVCTTTKIKQFLDLHPHHKFITIWVPLHVSDMKFGGAAMPHSLSTRGNDRVN